jgi:hypothetical protein
LEKVGKIVHCPSVQQLVKQFTFKLILKRIERVDIIPEFRALFHLLSQAEDQGSRIHPRDFPGKTFT